MKKFILACAVVLSVTYGVGMAKDVYVTIPPLKYFTDRIMGEEGQVEVVLAPGQNPHSYSPSAKQIVDLSRADILFAIGVPFEEAFLPKLKENAATLKIVDASQGLTKRTFKHSCQGCAHGHHDHHDHGQKAEKDPHVWLSPALAIEVSENILKALVSWQPENKARYSENYKQLKQDLEALDKHLKDKLQPIKGSALFVYHPAYGYFADAYGLRQEAIEVQGKQPTPENLKELITLAKKEKAKVIFVQKQFPTSSAQAVADAIGGVVMSMDPLSEDYINNLKQIGEQVSKL